MKVHAIIYRDGDQTYWTPVCALCQKPKKEAEPMRSLSFSGYAFLCVPCEEKRALDSLSLASLGVKLDGHDNAKPIPPPAGEGAK